MTIGSKLIAGGLTAFGLLAATSASACPDYSMNGEQYTYSSEELYSGKRHRTRAGGDIDLGQCSDMPGGGWVTRQPDFTIRFTGNNSKGRRLRFKVDSECDAVMLVNGPDARWRFDDDSAGDLDPEVSYDNARDGFYDVWIGTVGRSNCNASIEMETF